MPPSVKGNMGEAIVEALAIECVAEKKFSEFFFESSELLKIFSLSFFFEFLCLHIETSQRGMHDPAALLLTVMTLWKQLLSSP